jgi:hypothetical protein
MTHFFCFFSLKLFINFFSNFSGQYFYLSCVPFTGIMNPAETLVPVQQFMLEFSKLTGLDPPGIQPRRYLWTDAFAVCNYLELFSRTKDKTYLHLALRLVDQVHHTLGQHRIDDPRTGWISGLSLRDGELHPTRGGLRIGKSFCERGPNEYYNAQKEWDRDGQYYHYLTKWMHALNRIGQVSGNKDYTTWAIELAHAAHAGFTHLLPDGGRKRMYWKMSIDLSYPLVLSMGQHDPLDGLITYNELQLTVAREFGQSNPPDLIQEITDMTDMCRGLDLFTDDPLGIGGLLADASGFTQLIILGGPHYTGLLESILDSAREGLESFTGSNSLKLPASRRLAFRELGLSIGLSGVEKLHELIKNNTDIFGSTNPLQHPVHAILEYVPLKEKIEQFWLDPKNRKFSTWIEHREINLVMLATSLAPGGFLQI